MIRRRAFVLILVLVVVMLLSLGAYSFTELMLTHEESAQLGGRQLQTRLLVDSGVEHLKTVLLQDEATRTDAGGIYDNPDTLRGVVVIADDDPNFRGSFSVMSPAMDDEGNLGGLRHGLEDESTRLNLNTLISAENSIPSAGRTLLSALPGMTDEIADAILDWLDEDDEPRELGCEMSYYSGLSPAYGPKNGPLETVEELLLVRGVTPQLLFGKDTNRNGMIDQHEMAPSSDGTTAAAAGENAVAAERGWSAYLTLFSLESNLTATREARVYLNDTDIQRLHDNLSATLPADWVTFIIAYRQSGAYTGQQAPQTGASGTLDLSKQGQSTIATVLDLIGAKTQVRFAGATQSVVLASPFSSEIGAMNVYLPKLMDAVTVNKSVTVPGRINLNQASATILNGIPGITPEIVSEIISRRDLDSTEERPNRKHESWIMADGIVTLQEMKTLLPFLTGGGEVYRAQVVGYYQGGQAASRSEVIIDTTTASPRIVFWRDISHLGRGYALETLGVDFSEDSSK